MLNCNPALLLKRRIVHYNACEDISVVEYTFVSHPLPNHHHAGTHTTVAVPLVSHSSPEPISKEERLCAMARLPYFDI